MSAPSPTHVPAVASDTRIPFRDHREILESNLARQIEAIRTSDAKILLLVPTTTAMLGLIAALMRNHGIDSLAAQYVAVCTAPMIIAYFFMAMTLIPRFRQTGHRSLLFFGGINTFNLDDYRMKCATMTPEAYIADLAAQCHATANIARTKYRHVRHAYLTFFVALPFWAMAIYLLNQGTR